MSVLGGAVFLDNSLSISSASGLFLKLDQSSPQTVFGGAPYFSAGIKATPYYAVINGNNFPMGMIQEIDELFEFGCNATQLASVIGIATDTGRQGMLCRMDARVSYPSFSLIWQDIRNLVDGQEHFVMQVGDENGFVALGWGHNTDIASADILGGVHVWGPRGSVSLVAQLESSGSQNIQNWIDENDNVLSSIAKDGSFSTTGAVSAGTSGTFNTINLIASAAQIIFDSTSGASTTLQDSASGSSKTITLPNSTTTLGGLATTQSWTAQNSFSDMVTINNTTDSLGRLLYVNKGYNNTTTTTYAIYSDVYVNNSGSGGLSAGYFQVQTAGSGAHTGAVYGINGVAFNNLNGGTVTSLTGMNFITYNSGAQTVTTGIGGQVEGRVLGTGNMTTYHGFNSLFSLSTSSGGTTTLTHYRVQAATRASGTGTIGTQYGLFVPDLTAAFVTNAYGAWFDVGMGAHFRSAGQKIYSSATGILNLIADTQVVISESYPTTGDSGLGKLYVQRRVTDPTSGEKAAFSATNEVLHSSADWSGSNQDGFAGGITVFCTSKNFNNGAAAIALRGNASAFFDASKTLGSLIGQFGSISTTNLGTGGTLTSGAAFYVFNSIGSSTTVTSLYNMLMSDAQNSGTITTQYGLYVPAMTAGSANYEIWLNTSAGIYFRASTQSINSAGANIMNILSPTIKLGSANTDTVDFIAGSDGTAPSTTLTPTFTSYYGGNTNALGDPNSWLRIKRNGTTYKVPLYT